MERTPGNDTLVREKIAAAFPGQEDPRINLGTINALEKAGTLSEEEATYAKQAFIQLKHRMLGIPQPE